MDSAKINLPALKAAVNDILDHMVEDLQIESVAIEASEDYYWDCTAPDLYDASKQPDLVCGRLSDDVDFCRLIKRAEAGAVSYNLVHIAPLLKYIGEKVKR